MKKQNRNARGTIVSHALTAAALLCCVPVLTLASTAVFAQGSQDNPSIISPGAKFKGLSYGEWGAKGWTSMFSYRVVYQTESPSFEFTLPQDNLFAFGGLDALGGTTSRAVDAGIYVMLTPLGVGHHTIHVGGTIEPLAFSIDATFDFTVVPLQEKAKQANA